MSEAYRVERYKTLTVVMKSFMPTLSARTRMNLTEYSSWVLNEVAGLEDLLPIKNYLTI